MIHSCMHVNHLTSNVTIVVSRQYRLSTRYMTRVWQSRLIFNSTRAFVLIVCISIRNQSRCFNCQSDCQYHTIVHNVPLSHQHCHFWSALGCYSTSTGIMIVSSFRYQDSRDLYHRPLLVLVLYYEYSVSLDTQSDGCGAPPCCTIYIIYR